MSKDTKITLNLTNVNTYLLGLLLIIVLFSAYSLFSVNSAIKDIKPVEPPKLAQLLVTVITAPPCEDCFNADAFAAAIQQLPLVNVTEKRVSYESDEGKKLIADYKLTRAPAAVVTGEIENVTIPGFNKTATGYSFSATPPPYYDLGQQRVRGKVAVTFITDKTCTVCFDITQFSEQLKQVNVVTSATTNLDVSDTEAKNLIKAYGITKVPTMILSGDAMLYGPIQEVWPQVGSTESDGALVLRSITAPYKDLAAKQVRGLITLTYLTDKSCADCYNVSLHKLVLEQSFNTKFKKEQYVDISSPAGKDLVQKYNITLVPTVVLDKEAEEYAPLVSAWPQIGTHFPDGTFVFQKVNLLQGIMYKDLSTGTVQNSTTEQ